MLIVEGPDGAGKTTLIEAFQEAFDIPVAPRVVTKETKGIVDLKAWVDNNLDQGFQRMIFDRHRLISETIYGPILRGKQEPGFDKLSWLGPRMQRLYHIRPIIIYCLPPLQTVLDNVLGDPDNVAVAARIESIYSAYVTRISMDLSLASGMVEVWDYKNSAKINHLPTWFNRVHHHMELRLGKLA